MFEVVISARCKVKQGLKAPVRSENNLPDVVPEGGFSVVVKASIVFEASQLNERGWFVDTDAVELRLQRWADYLSSDTWTSLFGFRPTFERVTQASYETLAPEIPQLKYLELENETLGVVTRYVR